MHNLVWKITSTRSMVFIVLGQRIYLHDTRGVLYPSKDSTNCHHHLKGTVHQNWFYTLNPLFLSTFADNLQYTITFCIKSIKVDL